MAASAIFEKIKGEKKKEADKSANLTTMHTTIAPAINKKPRKKKQTWFAEYKVEYLSSIKTVVHSNLTNLP